jgi:histo-blood group ABO system transferase
MSTISRFGDYAKHQALITADLVLFLDADMELADTVGPGLTPHRWPNGIALVLHPGFFAPSQRGLRSLYSRMRQRVRARGSWETRPESLAYLPDEDQRFYVCGGVWMGRRAEVIALCALMDERIREDEANGIVAVWHDESHLNWWAATHNRQLLPPEYCYADGYPNLTGLRRRIVAIEKPAAFVQRVKGSPAP